MRLRSSILALGFLSLFLSIPVLAADDKAKKDDDKKVDKDKAEVKKDAPAKKDGAAKKDDPAKKDDKKADPAKKDAEKKDAGKKTAPAKGMPAPPKGAHQKLERDPAAAAEKMMRSTKVTATVMAVVEDKKSLRLQLTIPYLKVNQGAVNNYNNAMMAYARATNPQQLNQELLNMEKAQAQIYEVATTMKEVEWQANDEVKVRMNNPPPQFDDKGRVKRYTAKELRELKGNDKTPGYPAEFSDLKTGQMVLVTLVQKKDAPRTPRRGRDAELLPENMPQMSFILIVAEPKQ